MKRPALRGGERSRCQAGELALLRIRFRGFEGLGNRGRSAGGRAHGGFADENGTWLDGEDFRFDIADDFGAGFQLHAIGHDDIAVDFAIDDEGAGFDFGLDARVFADGEIAVRVDFAFDFPIDHEVIGEFHDAFDFHVGTQHVATDAGGWAMGGGLGTGVGSRERWCGVWFEAHGFRLAGGSGTGFDRLLANYFLKHGRNRVWVNG